MNNRERCHMQMETHFASTEQQSMNRINTRSEKHTYTYMYMCMMYLHQCKLGLKYINQSIKLQKYMVKDFHLFISVKPQLHQLGFWSQQFFNKWCWELCVNLVHYLKEDRKDKRFCWSKSQKINELFPIQVKKGNLNKAYLEIRLYFISKQKSHYSLK